MAKMVSRRKFLKVSAGVAASASLWGVSCGWFAD
ncbi:MAG: twin-arginine translocation signal domain-containing protein, partial [Calditrichaeota bacterium]|nr:twin-arginine translocation signal domain-containing protein [Calditrichota bacterium]